MSILSPPVPPSDTAHRFIYVSDGTGGTDFMIDLPAARANTRYTVSCNGPQY
jgi:hypothetical protein